MGIDASSADTPPRALVRPLAVLGLSLWLVFAAPVAADHAPPLSFGVAPQQPSTVLAQMWVPLLSYLTEQTGYHFEFRTARDIRNFDQRVAAGTYDLAYISPYLYTLVNEDPGYRAIAREAGRSLKGMVVVHAHSPYSSLEDLVGLPVAFPAPAAFAASVLPQAELDRLGVVFEPIYVTSHQSVYLNVARGMYPAGGGVTRTYHGLPPEVREQLRVLWLSDGYSPHPFVAHPRVPDEIIARIEHALISMDADPRGGAILEQIGLQGIQIAEDSDYDGIRHLGLDAMRDHLH